MKNHSRGLTINKKAIERNRLKKIHEQKVRGRGAIATIIFAVIVYTYIAVNYFNLITL